MSLPAICHTHGGILLRKNLLQTCAQTVPTVRAAQCVPGWCMVTFQGGKQGDFSWGWPDWQAAGDDIQACCNHGLFRDYSLYPRKRLVSHNCHPGLPALPYQVSGQSVCLPDAPAPQSQLGREPGPCALQGGDWHAELIFLCLPTSGLPHFHVQDTQGQVQTGAGSAHHGLVLVSLLTSVGLCTLFAWCPPSTVVRFSLTLGDHWAREPVGAHQVSGLHPQWISRGSCALPKA